MGSKEEGDRWQMKLKEELIKAQQLATRLMEVLQSGPGEESLVDQVLSAVSKALVILDAEGKAAAPLGDEHGTEISGLKKKKILLPRRVGYRRRAHPYKCRTILAVTNEDGYAWRKYGQKDIHGAAHPRSYYRCIHKHDRGCQATRQVQKTEDDVSVFSITYMGEHTCADAATLPVQGPPCVISFESNTAGQGVPSLKQECDEEVVSSHSPADDSSSAFPDFSAFMVSAAAAADQYDVTSVFRSSTSSLDMEFDPETFNFDGVFSQGDEYIS
ncbi:transcription factor WRKY45-2-like [Musa acuminata AAA Group]|uniref:transcription factor WRKY45-2-like n=1 Tax=Musa acuminata AAA Group TaxID=214697 RepID=UPI0031D47666